MSGSPLMIDGRLAGALSRRLVLFEKDGHFGFTPAHDMQDVSKRGHLKLKHVSSGISKSSLFTTPLAVAGGANGWPALEDKMKEWFPGTLPVIGGQTGKKGEKYKDLPPLQAGSPIAVVLMDGDISISGTGTVTWVDGDQVVGFGHAMFGLGPTELPIAPAEIITVIPSFMTPHKIANAGSINGTLDQDRHSAVSGRIGPVPEMATYRIQRKHNHEVRPVWQGRMVKHHLIAPQLIAILGSNAMMDAQDFSQEVNMRASTRITFKELEPYVMEGVYSGGQMERMLGLLDQLLPLMRIMGTYGKQLELENVEFSVETIENEKNWIISSLDVEANEVEVGEKLNVIIELINLKGASKTIRTSWIPPEELRGKRVALECVSGMNLNFFRQHSHNMAVGDSPASALHFFKTRFNNDHVYLRAVQHSTALMKSGRLQSGLPHTVKVAAQEVPAPDTSLAVDQITFGEKTIQVDGMVAGHESQWVQVK